MGTSYLASPVPNVLTRQDEQEHTVRRGLHARRGEESVKAIHGVAPNRGACLCLRTPLVRFGADLSFGESCGEVRCGAVRLKHGNKRTTPCAHRSEVLDV